MIFLCALPAPAAPAFDARFCRFVAEKIQKKKGGVFSEQEKISDDCLCSMQSLRGGAAWSGKICRLFLALLPAVSRV